MFHSVSGLATVRTRWVDGRVHQMVGDMLWKHAVVAVYSTYSEHTSFGNKCVAEVNVSFTPTVAVFRSHLKAHLFDILCPTPLWQYSACAVMLVASDTVIISVYLITYQGCPVSKLNQRACQLVLMLLLFQHSVWRFGLVGNVVVVSTKLINAGPGCGCVTVGGRVNHHGM